MAGHAGGLSRLKGRPAAEAFHDTAGPAIEQARRGGKLAIQAATTAEGVATALADALGALAAV